MEARIKLKTWLMTQGMRQGEFAKRIGVKQDTVSMWVNGKARPNIESASKIEVETQGGVMIGDWMK